MSPDDWAAEANQQGRTMGEFVALAVMLFLAFAAGGTIVFLALYR